LANVRRTPGFFITPCLLFVIALTIERQHASGTWYGKSNWLDLNVHRHGDMLTWSYQFFDHCAVSLNLGEIVAMVVSVGRLGYAFFLVLFSLFAAGAHDPVTRAISPARKPSLLLQAPSKNMDQPATAASSGIECTCDLDCEDGDPCTADSCTSGFCLSNTTDALGNLCDDGDGDFCTNGACDNAGNCMGNSAGHPCPPDEICNESTDACDECTTDDDCDALDNPPICLQGVCNAGRCMQTTMCPPGERCSSVNNGQCIVDTIARCCQPDLSCAQSTYEDCDGLWDHEFCDCPHYSSGINTGAGAHGILKATEVPCSEYNRIGDDFELIIDDGMFLRLDMFRFIGGPAIDGKGDGTACFEFWDPAAAGGPLLYHGSCEKLDGTCDDAEGNPDPLGKTCRFDSDCSGIGNGMCGYSTVARGPRLWRFFMDYPYVILPKSGYITITPGVGSGETITVQTTDTVGLAGGNDPSTLFVNYGIIGPVLSPESPDVLAFEFRGDEVTATGACCYSADECDVSSTVNTEWLCGSVGGVFYEGIDSCDGDPCSIAACCIDGGCEILTEPECLAAGGLHVPDQASCNPNCCPQEPSGSDSCSNIPDFVFDTASTWQAIELDLAGDNSTATNGNCELSGDPCRTFAADGEDCPPGEACIHNGECALDVNDAGWFVNFEVTSNAYVEISYCCTSVESPGARVYHHVEVINDCDVCSTTMHNTEVNPMAVPCGDGNPSDMYFLEAGTYSVNIMTQRYCANSESLTQCSTNADCGAEGPCVDQTGPYTMHIRAQDMGNICPCCLGSVCVDTLDYLECLEAGGVAALFTGLHGGTGQTLPLPQSEVCLCVPVNPCLLGACCLGQGECDDNEGDGIDQPTCESNSTGQYLGGARCTDNYCPECDILADDNCQRNTGNFIVQIDRAVWNPPDMVDRWADDFRVTSSGFLDRVCWWPAFFNPDESSECSAPGEPPEGGWEMTIYADEGGLPGPVISPTQSIDPDEKVSLGAASRVWLYSAPVMAQPFLAENECYWMEITGEGEGVGGCRTYWLLSADGNSYSLNDIDNNFGSEDIVTEVGGDPAVDLSFCVSLGMDVGGCGEFTGACCTPDSTCTEKVPVSACMASGGAFHPSTACSPEICPPECEAPTCEEAIELTGRGESCENGTPCSRSLDTSFCMGEALNTECEIITGPLGTSPLGAETWFSYDHIGPAGVLEFSMCHGTSYDTVLAVYDGGIDCTCPIDESDPTACGDDTCGTGGGPSTVSVDACDKTCWLIKVGGWMGDAGQGNLNIDFTAEDVDCSSPPESPLADDRFDINGTVKACSSDADCKAGETPPDPQTVCRDGSCYVARQRYLALRGNPNNAGESYAIRVSLFTSVAGVVTLGFFDEPFVVANPAGAGPNEYVVSRVVDTPHYMDWAAAHAYFSAGDCEVSPDQTYRLQSILDGYDIGIESNYSLPLDLPTVKDWGDVTGGGNPGDPPNGSAATLSDAFAAIKAFLHTHNEPRDWTDVDPYAAPNAISNLADAVLIITGFQLQSYGGDAPLDCP
jgi:hypothetical protein